MERVSIIIPCYNSAATIVDTVRSALAQQNVTAEVILVDDGSTDGTKESLEAAGLLGQIVYFYQDNTGVSSARNRGLEASTGRYVCFLDSDDLLMPSFSGEMIQLLNDRRRRVGYCNYEYVDETRSHALSISYPRYEGDCAGKIISEHFIPTPAVVLSEREVIGPLRFEPSMRNAQDWYFWINLFLREPICYTPTVLVTITHRTGSLSRGKDKMNRATLAVMRATQRLIDDHSPRLSDSDLAEYYYRYASYLLWEGDYRAAARAWRNASERGLGIKRHGFLATKGALRVAQLHRVADSLLWSRMLRREMRDSRRR